MRLHISLEMKGRVRPSVRMSVRLMLFSNEEKRHFPCFDDDEIQRV